MPTIDYVFLCDYAFQDAAGKTSIIGVFENINAAQLPFQWPQLFVALKMKVLANENLKLRVVLNSPTSKELFKIEVGDLRAEPTGQPGQSVPPNTVLPVFLPLPMYSVQFAEPGQHHIEIFVNGNPVHSLPINVMYSPRK